MVVLSVTMILSLLLNAVLLAFCYRQRKRMGDDRQSSGLEAAANAHLIAIKNASVTYGAATRSAVTAYLAVANDPWADSFDLAIPKAWQAYDAIGTPAREAFDASLKGAGLAFDAAIKLARDSDLAYLRDRRSA